VVTVLDVELFDTDGDVVDFRLEQPTAGSSSHAYALTLEGHLVARAQAPTHMEITGLQLPGFRFPINTPRPDLAKSYPDIPWVLSNSGFRKEISVLGLPSEFEFVMHAVLANDRLLPLATVRGSRSPHVLTDTAGIQPVMVTTLGRTGSQLLMNVLSRHPAVVVYPIWIREAKTASYWADVFSALANPGSYLQPMSQVKRGQRWWLGDHQHFDEKLDDQALMDWLGDEQVEEVGRFCRDRISAFYERLAGLGERSGADYFVEKCVPRPLSYAQVLEEMFPGTREVVLVRDFRDVLCSIFAYNAHMGVQLFGRDRASDDEEFVRKVFASQLSELIVGWERRSQSAHLLRYEDLIHEPEQTIESLLSYLRLDSGREVMDDLLTALAPRHAAQLAHGTSESAKDSIGRWQRELEPSLRRVCDEVFSEAFRVFGYSS
jgi:sulfotransferase family protein